MREINLKLVKVDNKSMLASMESSKDVVVKPMEITEGRDLRQVFAEYLKKDDLNLLVAEMRNSNVSYSERDLTEEELHDLHEVLYLYERAEKTFLKTVLHKEFDNLMGKL